MIGLIKMLKNNLIETLNEKIKRVTYNASICKIVLVFNVQLDEYENKSLCIYWNGKRNQL